MFEFVRDILAIIGFGVTFSVITILISIAIDKIRNVIKARKYKYKREHRFNGPPLAKCYCKDCQYWLSEKGECLQHSGWYVADDWFCWSSTPRLNDPEEM